MPTKKKDDWRTTSVFLQPEIAAVVVSPKKQTLLVDLQGAAEILGIPFTAVRRLISEGLLPATRAGRGGKFMIARTAIEKYAERMR
jgi:excisionase family DNA binding protein